MAGHLTWTSALIQALYKEGVTHAVISPGSRSTPLTIAAAIHLGIEKKIILDERSAAFIALGIGKNTGKPALLICTSGTAVANYFPAVIEARESGVPLIILSADRPPSLRGIGSSQTIDQLKLFGGYPVFFHEAGEPTNSLERLRYAAKQAVHQSIDSGGASHINLPFDKPLEPSKSEIEEALAVCSTLKTERADQPKTVSKTIKPGPELRQLISKSSKPIIIAGPSNPHHSLRIHIKKISTRLNAPIIAEPGSRVPDHQLVMKRYEQFLRNSDQENNLKPDLIIRFGDQPFTKSVMSALDRWKEVQTIHFSARTSWQDQSMSVNHTFTLQEDDKFQLKDIEKSTSDEWTKSWLEADKNADSIQKKLQSGENRLTDGHLFSHIGRQIGSSWNVMLSNSFPPRDMAMFGKPAERLFVNRGAAGIDGIISTALGIQFSNKQPVCAIVGDLAFLHDSNALFSVKDLKQPFVIIVVNNGGGNIFKMLPIYDHPNLNGVTGNIFTDYFATPQDIDIESLAKASGLNYQKVTSKKHLEDLQLNQYKSSTVVECITDSDASMKLRENLWEN